MSRRAAPKANTEVRSTEATSNEQHWTEARNSLPCGSTPSLGGAGRARADRHAAGRAAAPALDGRACATPG